MPNLLSIIQRIRRHQADDNDWLYVAGPIRELTLDTDAELACSDIDEATSEEILPAGFAERGLQSTIDLGTIESCIQWADQLSRSIDNNAALDVIRYYILFDAYPETLNAPDPPPADEILRRLDREFCQRLGPENPAKPCRREGCNRGAVNLSVVCRKHHFESIRKRPYPFDD
jgi:hypothetical protein